MTENERVKEIRKAKSLTLERFGEKIGLGKTAISKIERGENNLTDQTRRSICREFGVSEEWLRTGEGEMFLPVDRDAQIEDFVRRVLADEPETFRRRLVSALARLGENDWAVFERFLADLAGEPSAPADDIDAEVEAYRRQRLLEKNSPEGSSASSPTAAVTASGSESA